MGINEIIAQGTWKAPVMESADNKLLNRLKLEREQLELAGMKANADRSNKLAAYMQGADPASPDYVPGMRQIDPNAAFEYEGKLLAREKDRVGLRSSKVTADQGEFKLASEKYDGLRSEIAGLKDNPQLSKPLVAATLQRRVQQGLMSQELFDDMVGSLPDDPAQIRTSADGFLRSKLTPEQQYTVFAPKPVERTDGASKTMMDENPLSPGFNKPLGAPVQLQVSPDARLTDARVKSEGAQNRAVSMRGQNMTDARAATKAAQPGRAMSATAQKELFEAEDMVDSAKSAAAALTDALKINKDAYSGYGAGTRATIMSNLGGSKAADATVTLDNIIQGQALSSMKAIFGGNPTEGERKILLDLQASSSKTPGQREEIIKRAQSAMERRVKFNTDKAASLRSGKYFSEQSQDGEDPVASRNAELGPVSVTSRDEVDRLPSGTQFTGPDGVVRIKP